MSEAVAPWMGGGRPAPTTGAGKRNRKKRPANSYRYKSQRVGRTSDDTRPAPISLRFPQIGEERIAQIELALDMPAAFILQFAGAIKIVDEVPFRLDQRELDLIAKLGDLFVVLVAILAMLDIFEPVAQMSEDRSDHRLGELAAFGERLEPFDRRLDRASADLELLLPLGLSLTASCVRETKHASYRGKRQAFADQGDEDNREGQNQDQIAIWKWAPVSDGEGDCKGGGKRDDAADAGKRYEERVLPRRVRVAAPDRRDEQTRQVSRGIHPNEASQDDHHADDNGGHGQFGERVMTKAGNERARLQTGDEKHHALDQIGQEIPEHGARDPGRRCNQPQAVPTDIEPRHQCREHAGAAKLLRRPIGHERRQDGEHDLDAGIADPTAQAKDEPANANSPHELTGDDSQEAAASRDK